MNGKALALAALSLTLATPARADSVSDFYKAKPVTLVVGYGTGGGYDVYGRIVARYIRKYIPGNPPIVVQNMPGAGSLLGANYLYNTAPKDATVFGIFAREMPLMAILGYNPNVRFDPRKFTWLGTVSSSAEDPTLFLRAGMGRSSGSKTPWARARNPISSPQRPQARRAMNGARW